MAASRRFAPSPHLRFVEHPQGWAAYHSLFGNLTLIDDRGRDLLRVFANTVTIDDAAVAVPGVSPSVVRSYANDLILRGFLVPAGCDEYALVEENERLRRERLQTGYLLRGLQLVLTRRCNYRCAYCFVGLQARRGTGGTQESMTVEIAEAAIERVIEVLRRNGNDCLSIELFGGEPLMNPSVIRAVLKRFGNEYGGVRILYSTTTNCALIDADLAALFRDYGVTVTVSVDMPSRVQGTRLAMAKDGDRIRRQLSILREHHTNVTFNSVISKETVRYIDGRALLDFAGEFDVRMIGLILDLDLDFYRNADNRRLAAEILLDTYDYGRTIGIPVGGYWFQIFGQIAGLQPIHLRSGYKTCPATGCKISVEPDGAIFPCTCTSGRVGDVSDLDAVLASKAYHDYALRAYRHAPECAGCDIEGFCSGVCMGSLENAYQRSDLVEAGACEIFRSVTRKLVAGVGVADASDLRLERRAS